MDSVEFVEAGGGCRTIYNASIVQLGADNCSIQHEKRVSVSSPLGMGDNSQKIYSFFALFFF